ncbi:bifunctional helix-turn-helix transcriptional regulator/GNAT family N-acetyltransferase (plasmid) [Deinococcus sp. KNUC1210]|uniref:GNAT family N-acetyltransferase n=1 Tax=Deinococcus sp. KNUC1210 TaxID=2917691 RepID=UPI001EEFE2B6|nr:GNAT family N-acetyltransferase [Deinococcus sp. KNUC1210]ULH13867.1 bifunctional helix-turn-helix transcriptional regulator/GNAT family N-acetyltransferase [Deinococcus sp. KNUC1210]
MSPEAAVSAAGPAAIPAAVYQLLGAFRCAMLKYDHLSAARIKASGLTVQQYALLVLIAGRGAEAPSIGEAAEELMLSHNSAVELSQRAQKAGLLVRRSDPQFARRTLLSLSAEGAARLDAATRRLVGELGQERMELQSSLIRWRTLLDAGGFGGTLQTPAVPPPVPRFRVGRAGREARPLLWNLLQLHLHGQSLYHQMDVGSDGQYPYPGFERYWRGKAYQPYLIEVGTLPAGFLLLHHPRQGTTELHELSLLPRFQGQGVGRGVMGQLFGLFPGRWSVEYSLRNLGVHAFWKRVLHGLDVAAEQDLASDGLLGKDLFGRDHRIEFSVPQTP